MSRMPGRLNAGIASVAPNGSVGRGFEESFGSRTGHTGRYTMSSDAVSLSAASPTNSPVSGSRGRRYGTMVPAGGGFSMPGHAKLGSVL